MNGRITASGGGPGVRQGGELALGVGRAFPECGGVFGRVFPVMGSPSQVGTEAQLLCEASL